MIRVVVAATYASVRAGLRFLLAPFSDIAVIGEAAESESLADLLAENVVDAVVCDLSAPSLDAVLDQLEEPLVPVVLLCDDPDDAVRLARIRSRAWSALQRSAGAEEISGALYAAVSGIVGLDPAFVSLVLPEPISGVDADSDLPLTPREREVLQLMAQGLPNKTIGGRLHISLSTAKFHVASILAKLGASSRTEAVTIGARRGLISL